MKVQLCLYKDSNKPLSKENRLEQYKAKKVEAHSFIVVLFLCWYCHQEYIYKINL